MEAVLNNIKHQFEEYIKKVDALYKETTKNYSVLFGTEPDIFCLAMCHIVHNFLESDGDSLFIQIPVDELGTRQTLQDKNFQKMEEAICHTLAMAVYSDNMEAKDLSELSEGDIFYTADDIECPNGETRPRLWKIIKDKLGNRPKEQFCDKSKTNRKNDLLISRNKEHLCSIFSNHKANTYKLNSLPDNNNEPTRKKMAKMAEMLGVYKNNKPQKHYKNALLVGFGNPSSMELICNYPYLSYPVDFVNKYTNIAPQEKYEIIVLVGDVKYNGIDALINTELAYGHTKKVIYIGSDKPAYFKGDIFSFTHRELYHYYANDRFPSFEVEKLNWDSLNDIIQNITSILRNDTLQFQDDIIKRATTYAITPYVGYSFFKDKDTIDERLLRFEEFASLPEDQWNIFEKLVINAQDSLQIKGEENPKTKRYKEIKESTRRQTCTLLEAYESYNNKIKKVCENNNKEQNVYVLDVCSDSNRHIEVVKCLLSKLALGKVYMLTYVSLQKIKVFFTKDYEIYNQSYRKAVLNNIEHPVITSSNAITYGSLDDVEYNLIDDLMTSYYNRNIDSTYYTLTGDNVEDDVRGDLIRCGQKIKASDLFEYSNDWLPCEFSYYVMPSCFKELRDIYYDFPPGKDINTYANLWKEKLQQRCKAEFGDDYKNMWEHDNLKFIKLLTFRDIIKGKYQSMFISTFHHLSVRMKAIGLFSDEELSYSLKAHAVSKKSRSLGGELKQGLYEYLLTGRCSVEVVNTICKNSSISNKWTSIYSLEKLKELCIKTNKIDNIVKSSKKHNDDE